MAATLDRALATQLKGVLAPIHAQVVAFNAAAKAFRQTHAKNCPPAENEQVKETHAKAYQAYAQTFKEGLATLKAQKEEIVRQIVAMDKTFKESRASGQIHAQDLHRAAEIIQKCLTTAAGIRATLAQDLGLQWTQVLLLSVKN